MNPLQVDPLVIRSLCAVLPPRSPSLNIWRPLGAGASDSLGPDLSVASPHTPPSPPGKSAAARTRRLFSEEHRGRTAGLTPAPGVVGSAGGGALLKRDPSCVEVSGLNKDCFKRVYLWVLDWVRILATCHVVPCGSDLGLSVVGPRVDPGRHEHTLLNTYSLSLFLPSFLLSFIHFFILSICLSPTHVRTNTHFLSRSLSCSVTHTLVCTAGPIDLFFKVNKFCSPLYIVRPSSSLD